MENPSPGLVRPGTQVSLTGQQHMQAAMSGPFSNRARHGVEQSQGVRIRSESCSCVTPPHPPTPLQIVLGVWWVFLQHQLSCSAPEDLLGLEPARLPAQVGHS